MVGACIRPFIGWEEEEGTEGTEAVEVPLPIAEGALLTGGMEADFEKDEVMDEVMDEEEFIAGVVEEEEEEEDNKEGSVAMLAMEACETNDGRPE